MKLHKWKDKPYFEYRIPEDKRFLISQAGYETNVNGKKRVMKSSNSVGHTELLEEIAKCDVVCSNCHRERTYRRKNG